MTVPESPTAEQRRELADAFGTMLCDSLEKPGDDPWYGWSTDDLIDELIAVVSAWIAGSGVLPETPSADALIEAAKRVVATRLEDCRTCGARSYHTEDAVDELKAALAALADPEEPQA